MNRHITRALLAVAVVAAICVPLSFCSVVKRTDLAVHGVLGWTVFVSTLIAIYLLFNEAVNAFIRRNGGSVTIHPATFVASRIALFELFTLATIGLAYAVPSLVSLKSGAGLAILYGALGLCNALLDLLDATGTFNRLNKSAKTDGTAKADATDKTDSTTK